MKSEDKNLNKPFSFVAHNGDTINVDDAWADNSADVYARAVVSDTVSDETHRLILTHGPGNRTSLYFCWLRRIDEKCWTETSIYSPIECDKASEYEEAMWDAIETAKDELVMAIGIFPRYRVEADWIDKETAEHIQSVQKMIDAEDPNETARRRNNALGSQSLF